MEANTTFSLSIDGIKIAEVESGPLGIIRFRYDSSRGDTLLAELPTITEASVVQVGEIARGKLIKLLR